MSTARQKAIEAIANTKYELNQIDFRTTHIKDLFGVNVFNEEVQASGCPSRSSRPCRRRSSRACPLDPAIADAVASADEGLGHREGRDPLHAPVPADDRPDRREARQLPAPDRRRHGHRRVQRQGAGQGRAGRQSSLPLRRHPRHLRGPRLHRLGPDQPGLHPGEPQRRHARHPHRLLSVDRRGARQEDAAAPLDGGPLEPGPAHPASCSATTTPRRSSPPSAPSRNTS